MAAVFSLVAAGATLAAHQPFGKVTWSRPVLGGIIQQEEALLILNGGIPLVVAALVCALLLVRTRPAATLPLAPGVAARFRLPRPAVALALLGAAGEGILLVLLWRGDYSPSFVALFVAGWLSLGLAVLLCDTRRPRLRVRGELHHLLFVTCVVALFLWLNGRDLSNWYYSAIGDEYSFYSMAKLIATGDTPPAFVNIFSQSGVYEYHPVLSSHYQALVMRFAGLDRWGWLFSSTLALGLSLIPLYYLSRQLGGTRVAIATTALCASSHYMFAYAHTGYNNSQILLPTILCLALAVRGLRAGSGTLLFLAGTAAGLGFYTYYPARITLPVTFLWLLMTLAIHRADRPKREVAIGLLGTFALGATVTLAPMVAVEKWGLIGEMFEQTAFLSNQTAGRPIIEHALMNALRSFFAFGHNTHGYHYVSGSLVDVLTSTLGFIGLFYFLLRARRPGALLVLLWFFVGLVGTGVVSQFSHVTISRQHYVLPAFVLFAGTALVALSDAIRRVWPPFSLALRPYPVLLVLVVGAVGWLNVQRFWQDTPASLWTTEETIALRAVQEYPPCQPERTAIITPDGAGLVREALISEPGMTVMPRLVPYEEASAIAADQNLGCYIWLHKDRPEAQQAMAQFNAAAPGLMEMPMYERSEKRWIPIYLRQPIP